MAGSNRRYRLQLATGLVALFACLAGERVALAQDPAADELARKHFESGVAYLEESDYDAALQAFEKAYELSKRPEILLNIAIVNERKGDLENAVVALKAYVVDAPEGEHRTKAELKVKNLEKRIEEQKAKAAQAQPAPAQTNPEPKPTDPNAAPEKGDAGASGGSNNLPAFLVLGLGAAAGAGAIVTGLVAKGDYDDAKETCSPTCTDDEVSSGKSMAMVSTVLTGVSLVGIGVGLTLLLTSGGESDEHAASTLAPRVTLSVDPRALNASAAWRF
jgi:tetratricopeptide (TPR) repeat protein